MELTYDIIPTIDGTMVRLNREPERRYHIEDPKYPKNEFKYTKDGIGNYAILANFLDPIRETDESKIFDEVWHMHFDGAHSRSGKGSGIVIKSPTGQVYKFAYILEFDATNIVVEYEDLLLGLEACKGMGIKLLNIKGDSYLIMSQVKGQFACKSERLKRYRNAVWDIMEFFEALNLTAIPRELNFEADELVVVASTLQPSENLAKEEIIMEIMFRALDPDNVDHWQVFDDDKKVINFLNNLHEFADFKVDCK